MPYLPSCSSKQALFSDLRRSFLTFIEPLHKGKHSSHLLEAVAFQMQCTQLRRVLPPTSPPLHPQFDIPEQCQPLFTWKSNTSSVFWLFWWSVWRHTGSHSHMERSGETAPCDLSDEVSRSPDVPCCACSVSSGQKLCKSAEF